MVVTTKVKNLMLNDDVAKASDIDGAISAAISSLGTAVSSIGDADQDPSTTDVTSVNDGTSITVKVGNVCFYGNKEYICTSIADSGDKVQTWREFGDEGAYVIKNNAISPVTTQTLSKISYDAKGLVTGSTPATKSDIPGMSDKVETSTTVAGIALTGNISKNDLLNALNVEDGSQVNVVESGTIKISNSSSEDISGTIASNSTEIVFDLSDAFNSKVDKVSGKGLSTNDFTDSLKTKYDTAASDLSELQTAFQSLTFTNNDSTTIQSIANAVASIIVALGGNVTTQS